MFRMFRFIAFRLKICGHHLISICAFIFSVFFYLLSSGIVRFIVWLPFAKQSEFTSFSNQNLNFNVQSTGMAKQTAETATALYGK